MSTAGTIDLANAIPISVEAFDDCVKVSPSNEGRWGSERECRNSTMSNIEREKRLDELNRKLGLTERNRATNSNLDEFEKREWQKKRLGYPQH